MEEGEVEEGDLGEGDVEGTEQGEVAGGSAGAHSGDPVSATPPPLAPTPPGGTTSLAHRGGPPTGVSPVTRVDQGPQPGARRRGIVAVALVAGLVGGAAGGAMGAALAGGGTTSVAGGSSLRFSNNTSTVAKPQDVQGILSKVEPGVVDIDTQGASRRGPFSFPSGGAGTGMVITSSGVVLTNAHVVSNASSISVTFPGQSQSHSAHLIGADTNNDVALIQVDNVSNLPTVQLGSSAGVRVGDGVIAVGNALGFGGQPTVTEGIVSALNRSLDTGTESISGLIQTDAAINPGNSGGPLVDSAGQVIGMNTAVASGTTQQPSEGIGFAIPVDHIKSLIPGLQRGGTSTAPVSPAFLGVSAETLTPDLAAQVGTSATSGALVDSVAAGSPAATFGLAQGDVITAVDGQSVASADQLASAIHTHRPGDTVRLAWTRGQVDRQGSVKLGTSPSA